MRVADRAGLPIASGKVQENRAFRKLRLYQFVPRDWLGPLRPLNP
jgi:hypothetical protein